MQGGDTRGWSLTDLGDVQERLLQPLRKQARPLRRAARVQQAKQRHVLACACRTLNGYKGQHVTGTWETPCPVYRRRWRA